MKLEKRTASMHVSSKLQVLKGKLEGRGRREGALKDKSQGMRGTYLPPEI